jgi:hypothetical protein
MCGSSDIRQDKHVSSLAFHNRLRHFSAFFDAFSGRAQETTVWYASHFLIFPFLTIVWRPRRHMGLEHMG